MKLLDFMKARAIGDAEMASLVGDCSPGRIRKWKYGERMPRLPEAHRIAIATNGLVRPEDFLPIIKVA